MSDANGDHDTFYLGLTMAGAISAGAYTAGVLDVLFEALDRHNARYQAGKDADWQNETADYPRHKVVLRVISGTSAGGVSAGLSVAGLIAARRSEDTPEGWQIGEKGDGSYTSASGYSYEYQYILKPLHHVWIEAMDLWRKEKGGAQGFLTNKDLENGPVVSALNSMHIDDGANAALENITWAARPYRFLSQDLDLFLTTTNLQGVPYEVTFRSAESGRTQSHTMSQHSTVRHFRVTGLGTQPHVSPWLSAWGDDGIPIQMPTQVTRIDFGSDDPNSAWPHFKTAAIATGAFPVGLAPRIIDARADDFGAIGVASTARGGAFPINLNPRACGADGVSLDTRPRPVLGDGAADQRVTYVAVDGGVANNEPFELARYTLRESAIPDAACSHPGDPFLKPNPRGAHEADRAVLMVDPFPEGPVYTPLTPLQAQALSAIVPAARKLVPALINQARFKPSELLEATSSELHSRFLIAPSRRETGPEAEARGDADAPVRLDLAGAQAIASGSFGGFGGFFDRAFRAHDYMLGRRNMHSFLANHFNLAARNPVLRLGRTDDEKIRIVQAGQDFYATRPPLPVWPRISQKVLDPILEAAQTRIRAVGAGLVGYTGLDFFRKQVLGVVWGGAFWGAIGGIESSITRALKSIVMAELIQRDQHHDFRAHPDGRAFAPWERKILTALANAGHTPIAVVQSAAERETAEAKGEPPRDLLGELIGPEDTDESRAHKLDTLLRPFLSQMEQAGRVWRAPRRRRLDERYTLSVLKPGKVWIDQGLAFVGRLRESVFGS